MSKTCPVCGGEMTTYQNDEVVVYPPGERVKLARTLFLYGLGVGVLLGYLLALLPNWLG